MLLPLVGGYFFVKNCLLTSYQVAREAGHRLYFRAIFAGIVLLFVAILVRATLASLFEFYSSLEFFVASLAAPIVAGDMGNNPAILAVSIYALLLGISVWYPLNKCLPRSRLLEWAIRDNDVECLLWEAASRSMPVAVTMENRKVYVGFLTTAVDPSQSRRTLSLLPLRSGYRDVTDGTLKFTTNYYRLYEDAVGHKDRLPDLVIGDFEIVLPMDRMQSINLFDLEAYEEFQRLETDVASVDEGADYAG